MTAAAEPPDAVWFEDLLAPLSALQVRGRVRVALSGGLDSVTLLYLAHQVFRHHPGGFSALHINHQLQPAAADFEQCCQVHCEHLGIPLERFCLDLGGEPGSDETRARRGRYRVFAECTGPDDLLLMAHHAGDQSETILFRVLRGSGVRGLAGIPAERPLGGGRLVRPWLGLTRQRLEAQARAANLHWVEDPTNSDPGHDRNYLRLEVLPQLGQRWPGLASRLQATAQACDESARLAAILARRQLAELSDRPNRLSLAGFAALSRPEQRNLLRYWAGDRLPASDTALDNLLTAAEDRAPVIHGPGVRVARYRGCLYRVRDSVEPDPGFEQALEPEQEVMVGGYRVLLQLTEALGQQSRFLIRFRQGGERIRPHPGGGSRPLKQWLQEQGIPPWERGNLPLVFRDGELVAVADYWQQPAAADGVHRTRGGHWKIRIRRDFD